MSSLKIVLATRNLGKLREIQSILSDLPLQLQSLSEYPDAPEAQETGSTYLENAREKARLVAEYTGHWALADDSGLEVEALGWKPGLHSARFAGPNASDSDNIQKLLREFPRNADSKRAVFRCILVLRNRDGREFSTEGALWGVICSSPSGTDGFGYDPIFYLSDRKKTLAELSAEEKNKISHRTQALEKMKPHLRKILG